MRRLLRRLIAVAVLGAGLGGCYYVPPGYYYARDGFSYVPVYLPQPAYPPYPFAPVFPYTP